MFVSSVSISSASISMSALDDVVLLFFCFLFCVMCCFDVDGVCVLFFGVVIVCVILYVL